MSKKGENIYRRKDGRYEGRYFLCYDTYGKVKYGYIYAKSYSEVKQKLTEKKARLYNSTALPKSTATYNEILTAWLKSVKLKVKESTYVRYLNLIDNHIRTHLGKYRVIGITNTMIEGVIAQLLSHGRKDRSGGLSAKTVSDILMIIKKTFIYANDCNIPVGCNPKNITVKKNEREMRVLTSDEQTRLLNFLLCETDICKFGVLLALYTGIRIGELCALKWEDFTEDITAVKICRTMQRLQNKSGDAKAKTKVIITEPKTAKSVRVIPLPSFLTDIAKMFYKSGSAYLLTGLSDKFIEPRTMQNKFGVFTASCGISGATFHSLRHTFATRCIERGFEIKTLSEILGHSSVNITLNRYVHSSFDLKVSNMEKLELCL